MNYFKSILMMLVVVFCINMGEGGSQFSTSDEPTFIQLEERQGSFLAEVQDELSRTVVRDISFFGHTSIGGVRKESDDSFNRLDLRNIREVEILKSSFESKRYSDKEFVLVKVVMANGAILKDLLAPKNAVICGIERSSGAEKAWWLRKVNKIVMKGKITFDKKKLLGKQKRARVQADMKFAEYEKQQKKKSGPSVIGSFIRIIDSFIDFVKTFFKSLLGLLGF